MDDKKEKMEVEFEGLDSEFVSERHSEEEYGEVLIEDSAFEEEKKEVKKIDLIMLLKKVGFGLIWAFIAFLLGAAELPFGALPFGMALLCAASSKLSYIYLGLCSSALFMKEGALVYICAYTATVFIRALSRMIIDNPFESSAESDNMPQTLGDIFPLLFSEHIFLRMASSCIGAFIIGIYTLLKGGFLYYDLFGTVLIMVASPTAVYLYCGLSGNDGPIGVKKSVLKAYVSDTRRFAAVCTLIASLVLATRDISVLGMSLSLMGAMLATLYFCRKNGIMYGLVAGTLCGLAFSPTLAPMFAFAAISAGALFGVSTFFACISAATVSVAWALYCDGISALTSVLPAALLACLLFAVVEKLYLADFFAKSKDRSVDSKDIIAEPVLRQKCEILDEKLLSNIVLDDTEQRVKVMCETFSSLSSLFYDLSEKMRMPAAKDMRQICDSAFDSSCHSCEMRSTCWESEYSASLAALSNLSSALGKNGHVSADDVSARLLERCSAMPEIINQINRNSTNHIQQLIIGDKTEIFALDYEAISDMLAATMTAQKAEFEYREELSQRALALIEEKKISARGVFVYGNDRKQNILLEFKNEGELYKNRSSAKAAFEEFLGEKLDAVENDDATLLLSSARRYKIEYAKRSIKAEGEEGFCGDTVSIFENDRGHFYSFISDGMGSGREAALTSGICSVFLSKVLRAINRCDISLCMLNGFLRNKGSGSMHECSATVDLLEYDLVTGKAEFYKGGAAPSYIYRDGGLFKLRSNTVPLGIIKELDAKKISIDSAVGDIIVMVSDGVTQSKEECPWLFDMLKANAEKESLATLADMIVKRAKYEGADDDISVVVMKVLAA